MSESKTTDMEFGKMRSSTDPNTGKIWPLPDTDVDPGLDSALAAQKDKKIVVIQGLGFVGAVMALICANADEDPYFVIGVDLPSQDAWHCLQKSVRQNHMTSPPGSYHCHRQTMLHMVAWARTAG